MTYKDYSILAVADVPQYWTLEEEADGTLLLVGLVEIVEAHPDDIVEFRVDFGEEGVQYFPTLGEAKGAIDAGRVQKEAA